MKASSKHNPITEFDAPKPFRWNQYLVGGEIHAWDGDFEKVYSPMGAVKADGTTEKV